MNIGWNNITLLSIYNMIKVQWDNLRELYLCTLKLIIGSDNVGDIGCKYLVRMYSPRMNKVSLCHASSIQLITISLI